MDKPSNGEVVIVFGLDFDFRTRGYRTSGFIFLCACWFKPVRGCDIYHGVCSGLYSCI